MAQHLARWRHCAGVGSFGGSWRRFSWRRGVLPGALAVAVVLSGCGGGEGSSGGGADGGRDGVEGPLALPVEPVLYPGADAMAALQDGYFRLVETCMEEKGFTFSSKRVDPPPEIMNPYDVRRRYGDLSPEEASQWGYHYRFAEYEAELREQQEAEAAEPSQPGFGEALSGSPVETATGVAPSSDGCAPQANQQIYGNSQGFEGLPGFSEILQVQVDSYDRAAADPEVVAAEQRWSDCMLSRGYRYTTSTGPLDQFAPATDDTSPPGDEERSTAEADAACRDEADLLHTYLRVESRIQVAALEGLQEQVDTLEHAVDGALRRSKDL